MQAWWSGVRDLAGVELSDDEREYLDSFTAFRRDAFDNINRYIKEITGAQMSEAEADRLRRGVPDPENDSPQEFMSKYRATMASLSRTRARAIYALQNGVTATSVSMDQFNGIINERGRVLEEQLRAQGVSDDQLEARVSELLRQEFGF